MPTVTTFIQRIGSPSHISQTRERKKKGIEVGKEEVKLLLLVDNMIYKENLKDSTKNY